MPLLKPLLMRNGYSWLFLIKYMKLDYITSRATYFRNYKSLIEWVSHNGRTFFIGIDIFFWFNMLPNWMPVLKIVNMPLLAPSYGKLTIIQQVS